MFSALANPIGSSFGLPTTGYDVMAISIVGFTGLRYLDYRKKYEAVQKAASDQTGATRANAMISGLDEAQQAFNWALATGAVLVVLPRVLKAVMS